MQRSRRRLFIGLGMVLLCLAVIAVFSAYNTPILVKGADTYSSGAPIHCEANSPRELVRTFLATMHNYEQGDQSKLDCLEKLIITEATLRSSQRDTRLLMRSRELLLVLENLNFDIEEDVAAQTSSKEYTLRLHHDKTPLALHMQQKDSGNWAFSSSTFTEPSFQEALDKITHLYRKFTSPDMEGDTFATRLMSPYRAYYTFLAGMRGASGMNINDAVRALDLSPLHPLLRPVYGKILAVFLYRILLFKSQLDLEELSANPATNQPPVFYVLPGMGAITMHVVTLDNGLKAWQFTPHSLQVVWDSYDYLMGEFQEQGLNPLQGTHLPLHTHIDDFFQLHSRQLLADILHTDAYKLLGLIIAVGLTPLVLLLVRLLLNGLLRILDRYAPEDIRPMARKRLYKPLAFGAVSLFWLQSLYVLVITPEPMLITVYVLQIALIIFVVWLVFVTVELVAKWITASSHAGIRGTIILITAQILKLAVLIGGLIKIADLFGQDSTRILTALGIGGVALALAGKDTLENIFGTVMLLTTRPFSVGDWIIVNNVEGMVENVGVRSTTVRTFYNSTVIVPNRAFITSAVDNMGRRKYRRYFTSVNLAYDTPPELLEGFVEGVRALVLQQPETWKTNFHVVVNDFGEHAIEVMIYIFFEVGDWSEELKLRHAFILNVLKLAQELGIRITEPVRRVSMGREQSPEQPEVQSASHAVSLAKKVVSRISKKSPAQEPDEDVTECMECTRKKG